LRAFGLENCKAVLFLGFRPHGRGDKSPATKNKLKIKLERRRGNMQSYIYLNFLDLSEEKQEELNSMASDEVREETTQEEADDLRMSFDDLVLERTYKKLLDWSKEGKFVFNI
jgi:hypothetical protein